jgi:hypothetical protein
MLGGITYDKNEDTEDLLKQLGEYKALDALKDSEGGQLIIDRLRDSIVYEVNSLIAGYKDMPELEIRTRLSKLSIFVPFVQALTRAKSNVEGLKEDLIKLTE